MNYNQVDIEPLNNFFQLFFHSLFNTIVNVKRSNGIVRFFYIAYPITKRNWFLISSNLNHHVFSITHYHSVYTQPSVLLITAKFTLHSFRLPLLQTHHCYVGFRFANIQPFTAYLYDILMALEKFILCYLIFLHKLKYHYCYSNRQLVILEIKCDNH